MGLSYELPFGGEFRAHPRARHLRVRVHPGGRVSITGPKRVSRTALVGFLERHRGWIERMREELALKPVPRPNTAIRQDYLMHKEAARRRAYALIAKLAPVYGVAVRSVSIRAQKSRWGSCSRSGSLSFNYRLALLPPDLAEYVVAHELCHLLEFNHSPRFWAQVARTVPNALHLRTILHASHAAYA